MSLIIKLVILCLFNVCHKKLCKSIFLKLVVFSLFTFVEYIDFKMKNSQSAVVSDSIMGENKIVDTYHLDD